MELVTGFGLTALLMLVFCAIINEANPSSIHRLVNGVHSFHLSGDLDFDLASSTKEHSQLHHMTKRDAGSSDTKCEEQIGNLKKEIDRAEKAANQGDHFVHKHEFVNETKFTMSLVWTGQDQLLVAVTEEMIFYAKPSSLYRSTDNGQKFESIIDRIDHSIIRKDNGMQKHPFRNSYVYLVCYTVPPNTVSLLYVTTNGGIDFKKVQLPFLLQGHIMFYPDEECHECHDWMLAREESSKKLYFSKNSGLKWQAFDNGENIVHFKWGSHKQDDQGTIYATFQAPRSTSFFDRFFSSFNPANTGDLTLRKTTNFGESWQTVKEQVFTFGMEGKFLYASVKTGVGQRQMHVSTDGGKNWNEVQLPTLTQDRFYSILDMSEGLIFMHVDNPGDTGHGTLYTSDGSGIVFSESLRKHLYPNYQEVTDFYKVNSMRGVYLASQMEADKSIHTMITFNRGGEWRQIKRPPGSECKDESKPCFLQISNLYSIKRGVKAQPPLSVNNSVGIIMVHGHVAEALQTTPPDVYVSSDGGYSWIKSLEGPHHCQIADHGGLLVAIPADTPTPKFVKFSTDEGRCWHNHQFTTEDIVITGLLTEPGNRAGAVSIWGFGKTDRKWRLHVLDFSKIITRECGSNDFEDWIAHSDMNHDRDPCFKGCLLGTKETFSRIKKDALCIHGRDYERTQNTQICECSQEDYECDYGYSRQLNSYKCDQDAKFKTKEFDICVRGHEEEIISQGYRKIPGDRCRGGFKPNAKEINLKEKCKGKDVIINEELKHPEPLPNSSGGSGPDRSGVIIAVVVIVLVLALLLFVYFVRKYNLLSRRIPSYKYSLLSQTERNLTDEADFENILSAATTTSIYEDSSDEESRGKQRMPVNASQHRDHGSISHQNGHATAVRPGPMNTPKVKQYHDDSDVDMLS